MSGAAPVAATLRPCPFCGRAAERCATPEGRCFVACTEAGCADGPTADSAADAATLWNSRFDDEALL